MSRGQLDKQTSNNRSNDSQTMWHYREVKDYEQTADGIWMTEALSQITP